MTTSSRSQRYRVPFVLMSLLLALGGLTAPAFAEGTPTQTINDDGTITQTIETDAGTITQTIGDAGTIDQSIETEDGTTTQSIDAEQGAIDQSIDGDGGSVSQTIGVEQGTITQDFDDDEPGTGAPVTGGLRDVGPVDCTSRGPGVNLSGCDLSNTDLSAADLSAANLSGCDLSNTDLSYADLRLANLSRANLRHADLSYANLSGANLIFAYYDSHTILRGTICPDGTLDHYTCRLNMIWVIQGTTPMRAELASRSSWQNEADALVAHSLLLTSFAMQIWSAHR